MIRVELMTDGLRNHFHHFVTLRKNNVNVLIINHIYHESQLASTEGLRCYYEEKPSEIVRIKGA